MTTQVWVSFLFQCFVFFLLNVDSKEKKITFKQKKITDSELCIAFWLVWVFWRWKVKLTVCISVKVKKRSKTKENICWICFKSWKNINLKISTTTKKMKIRYKQNKNKNKIVKLKVYIVTHARFAITIQKYTPIFK